MTLEAEARGWEADLGSGESTTASAALVDVRKRAYAPKLKTCD